MGAQIYKNGEWVTPTLKRYKDGSWVSVTSMKRYINGEWVEILSNPPVATIRTELISFVSDNTSYTYDISENGTKIKCNINNAMPGINNVPFIINKGGGFGKTIKLKYTITQTMTTSAYASTRWLKMDFAGMSDSLNMWYNYQPRTNETFEGTLNFDTDQQFIYLLFEAYSGNLASTVSNVYINDELVTFT